MSTGRRTRARTEQSPSVASSAIQTCMFCLKQHHTVGLVSRNPDKLRLVMKRLKHERILEQVTRTIVGKPDNMLACMTCFKLMNERLLPQLINKYKKASEMTSRRCDAHACSMSVCADRIGYLKCSKRVANLPLWKIIEMHRLFSGLNGPLAVSSLSWSWTACMMI